MHRCADWSVPLLFACMKMVFFRYKAHIMYKPPGVGGAFFFCKLKVHITQLPHFANFDAFPRLASLKDEKVSRDQSSDNVLQ